jgi:hypothetical protein
MGDVDPKDDQSIADDALLLRRVPSKPNLNVVWDANLGCWRPSSASFENDKDGSPMSVQLSDTLAELGLPMETALKGHEEGFSLAAITARTARKYDQSIIRDPTEDEPAHGLVVGEKPKRISRKLAKSFRWIVPPPLKAPPG